MKTPAFAFLRIKAVALSVIDLDRAKKFYGHTLGLQLAYEGGEHVGFLLGDITLMLKSNWYASPTQEPNPRITMETDDALQTQRALQERGVRISDPINLYGEYYVGAFLDSEGNKLWFCSPARRPGGDVETAKTSVALADETQGGIEKTAATAVPTANMLASETRL